MNPSKTSSSAAAPRHRDSCLLDVAPESSLDRPEPATGAPLLEPGCSNPPKRASTSSSRVVRGPTATARVTGLDSPPLSPDPKADRARRSALNVPLRPPTVRRAVFMRSFDVAVAFKALFRRRSHCPGLAPQTDVPSMGFAPLRDDYLPSLHPAGSRLPRSHRCELGVVDPRARPPARRPYQGHRAALSPPQRVYR
jgi:hypothetical protein